MAILSARGIFVIQHLPQIGDDSEFRLRSVEEIHRRMCGNFLYFMRGQVAMAGAPLEDLREYYGGVPGWDHLTLAERVVVEAAEPTDEQVIESSWALEAVNVLAWAIGVTPGLPWPNSLCDLHGTIDAVRFAAPHEELAAKPLVEVLDQADLHYRLHWACRQCVQVEGKPPPGDVDPSVVLERRRALEWLISDQCGWDDVDLST